MNWTTQNSGNTAYLYSVYFSDENTGYAVGADGAILKTINGGIFWDSQNSGTSIDLHSVYFTDANTGYAVGGDTWGNGTIVKTTNGGMIWTQQNPCTSNKLNSIYFTNADTGYIVGEGGTILISIGDTPVGFHNYFLETEMLKIYPNPSSAQITIEISEILSDCHMYIFDFNGREILNQTITKLTTQLDISALPGGIYLVKVINNKMVKAWKIVIE